MEENGKKSRSKKDYVKRYALFLVGLILTSFGIAFVTKMQLGTSPISSIPYSLSIILPSVTMGNWTIIFSILLILLQFIISFPFGHLIDASMLLLENFNPQMYAIKIVCLLLGCAIIALGVYVQVLADVVMLPGDAFVRAIAQVTNKEFGSIRVRSDIVMMSVAALLCIIFLHNISGVREATVIAALITGNMVKVYRRVFEKILA